MNETNSQTLLTVLAHPDDETFGMGGTLALYAQQGINVHLICATRGEVGEMDEQYMEGFSSIAQRREYELRCASQTLGLKGVHFLDYRDSGMPGSPDNHHPNALAAAPIDEVAAQVTYYIRLLKPQVVVTFDPIGGYRHPDHIAIHNATVKAFQLASDPAYETLDHLPPFQPDRLYYQTISRGFLRLVVSLMSFIGKNPREFGKNKDIDLKSIAEVDFPVHARINYRSVAETRDKASSCHASQGGGLFSNNLVARLRRAFFSNENYMQAYPVPTTKRISHNLFEDIPSS